MAGQSHGVSVRFAFMCRPESMSDSASGMGFAKVKVVAVERRRETVVRRCMVVIERE